MDKLIASSPVARHPQDYMVHNVVKPMLSTKSGSSTGPAQLKASICSIPISSRLESTNEPSTWQDTRYPLGTLNDRGVP
jgi:hypothetical protein